MIVQPMDTQERRIREELRALAHQDRSLGASVATEQAVMARWDAEHVAGAQRSGRSGRSDRIASWIPAAAAAALLAGVAAEMTWTAEPSVVQPTDVAAVNGRRPSVVAGPPDGGLFIQLGPVTSRELNGPSLQLMRVQLRRGLAYRLGLDASDVQASEMVEADVLFGEDGIARAIRFER
jgi:hypothetical protein